MTVLNVHSGRKLWSLEALASEFNIDRRTVKKRIAHIKSDGLSPQGHPRWHVANVCLAILEIKQNETNDPDKLPPRERLDHYKAEREKIALEKEQALLIPYEDQQIEMARTFKIIANYFDTLPDVFERELGLDGEQVQALEDQCDKTRNQLADLIAIETDDKDE